MEPPQICAQASLLTLNASPVTISTVPSYPSVTGKKRRYLGLAIAVTSSIFFSLSTVIVKKMDNLSPNLMTAYRFVGILLPTLPIITMTDSVRELLFPRNKRALLFIRGVAGSTSMMLIYYAFQIMPLGDASVIMFSQPIFVPIFAKIFLQESCGIMHGICIALTLTGLVLIARPSFLFANHGQMVDNYWKACFAILGGTVINSTIFVVLRKLQDVPVNVVLLHFSVIAIVMSSFVTTVFGGWCIPVCGKERWMIVALGVLGFGAQALLTLSLQLEQAGPVSIALTSNIVFAFIWQIIFFEEDKVNIWSVTGALLVTSSVLGIGLRAWVAGLPTNSRTQQMLRWMIK